VTTVLEQHTMSIETEDDIILVRRKVRDVAQACKFDVFATSAITTAASEIARNVWTYAHKGSARIEKLSDGSRLGVRMEFDDEGPGIPDLDRALAGGNSTARSMGLGLAGSKRLVDEFSIDSEVGRGTKVMLLKWTPY
jgi:serine/threonine-protein kinase RsbT